MKNEVGVSRKDAKERGLTHYFTGVPCKRGHVEKRFVSDSSCVLCAYERVSASQKKYPERKSVSQDRYRNNNLSKFAAKEARRRFQKVGATPPWLTPEQLADIESIYEFARSKGYHVDHIVPLKHDKVCGLHVPWNLQALTPRDNLVKHNRFEIGEQQ